MNLLLILMMLPGLVIGLTLHEFAHAWSASLLGDDFARRQKRVSLNPLRHLSLLGTLALFVIHFGWGKPVPVNLYNFKHPRRDYLITSLAGPTANVLVAAAAALLMLLTRRTYAFGAFGVPFIGLAHAFLSTVVLVNVILATVNLLPIPPLDGSKIWPCVIPGLKPSFGKKTTMLFIILLIFLLRGGGLDGLFGGVVDRVWSILPETDQERVARLVALGSAAYGDQRYDEAERHLSAALAIRPDNADALHWRAHSRNAQGRSEEALADVNRAIELARWHAALYELRAEIRRATGAIEEMTADYERADVLHGGAAAWLDIEAARQANRAALDGLNRALPQVKFERIPLADALQFCRDVADQSVRIDWEALKDYGLTPRTPVSVSAENQTVRWLLKTVLSQADPDEPAEYGVGGGEIVIPAGAEGGTLLKGSATESRPSESE